MRDSGEGLGRGCGGGGRYPAPAQSFVHSFTHFFISPSTELCPGLWAHMVVTLMLTLPSCLGDFWLPELGAQKRSLSLSLLICNPETEMPTLQGGCED